MAHLTLDDYMSLEWTPIEELLEDGTYRLTVRGLADFEVFDEASMRLRDEWKTALRSHLQGYLAVGKAVPMPAPRISVPQPALTATSGLTETPVTVSPKGRFSVGVVAVV